MLHARGLFHIPNGDVLLFGASCAQIMFACKSSCFGCTLTSQGYRDLILCLADTAAGSCAALTYRAC